jgi:asparagine synthase (glutamine-hydrolysing)
MCGITGFWRPRGLEPDARLEVSQMMATLHHRGPDGRGMHLDAEHGLAMGHTRLSIIDLGGGAQPLHDGPRVLTVNGELYEYKRVRAEAACDGRRFATKSDSEIAFHLYRKHGLTLAEHMRGEFAFALWDGERRQLMLVRDRFGVKPLYFRVADDTLWWGSEVKAILAHSGVPRRLCRRAALHQLMQVMVPGTTAFEGIEALQPGCMLIVRAQGSRLVVEQRRWWDLDYPHEGQHDDAPAAEHVRRVREHLIDAVRVRLEADVPVGCYLSGGIDSCSILGLATAMQQSPVKAFTIAFDHGDYDERAIAIEMAEATQADQELLALDAGHLYGDAYVRTLVHAERTFYNTLAVAKWQMSRRVRACGFKVVVTGEGADEMYSGYPFFKRDLFLHARHDAEAAAALDHGNAVFRGAILAESGADHPAFTALCGFTPAWIQPWLLTHRLARPLLADDVLAELVDYDPVQAIAESLDAARIVGRHPLDKAHYTWAKTMLEGQILTWGGDRVDMANSLESRPAFLDHHLAEHARTIPPGVRVRGTTEKWVLREAMRGVLPDTLYRRQKFAFMAPPAHTDSSKRRALEQLVRDRVGPEQIDAAGLFDRARLHRFIEACRHEQDSAKAARNDIVLNHVLCLHLLHQELASS